MESYWEGYTEIKPHVKLENWYITSDGIRSPYKAPELHQPVLHGNAYGHPKFDDGDIIFSTPIVSINGKYIETKNTIYELGKIDSGYLNWCTKNGITINNTDPIKHINHD